MKYDNKFLVTVAFIFFLFSCSEKLVPRQTRSITHKNLNHDEINFWLTEGNRSQLFQQQKPIKFSSLNNQIPFIEVDPARRFQEIDGFGFCLTDGSAQLINSMGLEEKMKLLNELFSTTGNSIGISYIRISIGASDLSDHVYSYDDLPAGKTDLNLQKFTIDKNRIDLIPILKMILKINPQIKILGSPWSAPAWMKDNKSPAGGSFEKIYFQVYANYFVKYIQAMKSEGIVIDAITPQNEPLNPKNNPSMFMSAIDQADFIKNYLGPTFKKLAIATKIICYDHNANVPQYPLSILKDSAARMYVDGSAFHLYEGNISALSQVHNEFPEKNIYFTEQYTGSGSSFAGDLSWAIQNLIIGATRNWSRNVLEWNLASDPNLGPHTDGGCTTCLGAITVDGNMVTRNQSYYIIAHASKFVRPYSNRIFTTDIPNLTNVGFTTPDGKKVLIVMNTTSERQSFDIRYKGNGATTSLNGGAVATYVW